jgi:hypothetical protein
MLGESATGNSLAKLKPQTANLKHHQVSPNPNLNLILVLTTN